MKIFIATTFACLISLIARAEIRTTTVEYREGQTVLEGVLTYDDSVKGKRPGVLVAHQWTGLGAYEQKRSEMLAQLGYVVLAVDIYGKGVRPADVKAAGTLANKFKSDRALLRARINAGFELLKKNELADTKRLAAIGYCFGGTTVLELARSGADVKAVVSFHGALNTPKPDDAKNIKGRVLALHGADDPFVPPTEVLAFQEEMRQAGVDWEFVAYGGAVHGFTQWTAGSDNAKGAAYNEKADKRSWEAMKDFFAEALR